MDYENLISALRMGNVPSENIESFCIGRENEINEFKNILDKLEYSDKSETRFIEGDFGLGKSFFLKLIEEEAFKRNFVVSNITLNSNLSMNKLDLCYRRIVKNLRCKTGTSLGHIINTWITLLKADASEEYPDNIQKQLRYVEDEIDDSLRETSDHEYSFASAIKYFYKLSMDGDNETANAALSWIMGNEKISAKLKKQFNVKGKVEKDEALNFLEALSIFIKSIGYAGLVILFDEAESTMKLARRDSRNNSYDNMREIFDQCSKNAFKGTLFVFAGTSRFYTDKNKGAPSYIALDDRIKDPLPEVTSLKNPKIRLSGFSSKNLQDLSDNIIENHENAYNWKVDKVVINTIPDIISVYEEQMSLVGGIVIPREYIRALISCLDIIQENPEKYDNGDSIIQLFIKEKEIIDEDEFIDDDW